MDSQATGTSSADNAGAAFEDRTRRIRYFARTDTGLVRKGNEDSYLVDPRRGLVVVADGMGGHAAGEIASRIAVETIGAKLTPASPLWPFRRPQRERERLIAAIRSANAEILAAATEEESRRGMGTTVVVLWLSGRRAHVAHAGDSRAYRIRHGELVALTHDHTWPSPNDEMRNVLTRAVGAEAELEVDHVLGEALAGDVFLLCSDGLTKTVPEAAILEALRDAADGAVAAQRLIDLAKGNGAPDNVTVALAYC